LKEERTVAKQAFVLNTHSKPTIDEKTGRLASNTKAGWQSSTVTKQTQRNIVATLDTISDMIADGTIKDGSIITTYTQVTFVNDVAPADASGIVVDGEEVSAPAPKAEAADAPF
jgi:hypothetical protein